MTQNPETLPRMPIRVAVSGVVLRDGEVLQVEFDDESGLHYNFPGGGVNAGETLEQALHREIEEETALRVTVDRLLLVLESVDSRNTNLVNGRLTPWNELRFFFLCTPVDGSEARLPDHPDANETAVRWFLLEQLSQINVLPQIGRELMERLNTPVGPPALVPNPKRSSPSPSNGEGAGG
jgi:8-oxo-dGTP diphosphatase